MHSMVIVQLNIVQLTWYILHVTYIEVYILHAIRFRRYNYILKGHNN